MSRKIKAILAAMTAAVMLFSGCGAPATSSSSAIATPGSTQPTSPASLVGNGNTCPPPAESIISLSPSNTQVLLALGLGDKLVAIDKYSAKLEGVKPGLPLFDIMKPDTELLVSLGAEIIFTTGMSAAKGDDPFKPVRDAGCMVVDIFTATNIDGIKESLRTLGAATATLAKAEELIVQMEKDIKTIADIGATIPETEKKTVFFEISAAPSLYSFGSGVYLDEMLTLIGAKNVLADQKEWVSVSDEAVIAANPDVILTNTDYIENPTAEIMGRKGWENIKAVQNKAVYYIDKNQSSLPNHNVVAAMKAMAKAIYPQQYASLS